jgi:hypothetical protein
MRYSRTLFCSFFLAACFAACKSATLIESFSTQFGLMHFVKSVEFAGERGRAELDFTYRDNDTMLVTCNFTIESKLPDIYALQRAFFRVQGKTIECDSLKLMYATRSENMARYTSTLTKEHFRDLFAHNLAQFVVQGKSSQMMFDGGKSFENNANAVRLDVLNLP